MLVDRRDKKRVILIPTEFIYIIAVIVVSLFFFKYTSSKLIFYPSTETNLLRVSAVIGFVMLFIHGVAKNLDDRHDTKNYSKKTKSAIRSIHLRISHQIIYLSMIVLLLAFALGEINNSIVVANLPRIHIVTLAAIIFALAFYRNLIHGNTWGTELVVIPLTVLLLAGNCYKNNIFLTGYPLTHFSLLTLILTFVFLVTNLCVNRYKIVSSNR